MPDGNGRPSTAELDGVLERLRTRREGWAGMGLPGRVDLLDRVIDDLCPLFDAWVARSLEAKRALEDRYAAGWEWSSGPVVVVRVLRGLRRMLAGLRDGGGPVLPGPFGAGPGGRVTLRAYPSSLYERIATPGTTADVWFRPGVSPDDVIRAQRVATEPGRGRTTLVLGAGNVSGLQLSDALTKLFVDRAVVVLKVSPVTEYLLPLMQRGLRALVEPGWLSLVAGGREEGAYLSRHPLVDAVHLTGSDRTYESIVFGDGPDGAARKARQEPLLRKPVTAELGNVAPAIVVPGPWTDGDFAYQAEHLASHLSDSGSFSCSRTRVILQEAGWAGRPKLLDALRRTLELIPPRFAFYPGAEALYERFLEAHPEADRYGTGSGGRLPWTLIPGLRPDAPGEICFRTESFCPVLAEATLAAASPAGFIERACDFANDGLWGTLTATFLVHPASLRDPAVAAALERAVERLRYGAVSINCIPGLAYAIGTVPWGSFPGNPPWDIQSGAGFANNASFFEGAEKVVLRAPFRARPRPLWFYSRRASFAKTLRAATRYEAAPSTAGLLALFGAALPRGAAEW